NALWRAQRSQRDAESRLRAARDLRTSLSGEQDESALLERATSQLAQIFAADGVSIMLTDERGELSVRSSVGLSEAARADRKRIGEGISGYVAQTGEPLLLSGEVADGRFAGNDPTIGEALVAPLRAGDRTLGVVNVKHRSRTDRYGQAQLESLSLVASDIAAALANAETLRQADDDRRQALVLYELSRFATLGNDPQSDLDSAVAMLADTLHHDAVAVWAHEGGTLRLRASRNYGTPLVGELAADDPTIAAALRERRIEPRAFAPREPRPAWAPETASAFLVAPIGAATQVHGLLVLGRAHGGYESAEADFAATLGDYLAGMLQKWSSSDVVQRGAASERRRIAQELHDGLAQELTGVVLALEGCQRLLDRDPSLLGPQLAKTARDARATLADVRQYMAALRHNDVGALSLPTTVARLVDDLRRQSGLRVELEESGVERPLDPAVERAVIRIVGEALRNVAQHATAASARVTLRYDGETLVATVEDDGRGFDVALALAEAGSSSHFGLVGMRERAEGVGGTLVVRGEAGRGTIVRAT
ncbi:MAG: GAF domain-containing protein, partial [Candidatus Limnocylindria bacterium]